MNTPDDQLKVLIAEDTVVGRQVLTRILTEAGCQVNAVANGQGVIKMLAGNEFHLVIMDCMMPGMDGFAASRAIRSGQAGEANSSLPIIAISGLASEEDRRSCLEAGMDELVQKPITRENLLPVVTAVLERQQGQAETGAAKDPQEGKQEEKQEEEQSLLQSLDDWSPGFMDNIIDQFLDDVPGDIAALSKAMEAEDMELLRSLAHRLRGSADVLSASKLSNQASALEKACSEKNLPLARQLGPSLIQELNSMLEAHE